MGAAAREAGLALKPLRLPHAFESGRTPLRLKKYLTVDPPTQPLKLRERGEEA